MEKMSVAYIKDTEGDFFAPNRVTHALSKAFQSPIRVGGINRYTELKEEVKTISFFMQKNVIVYGP